MTRLKSALIMATALAGLNAQAVEYKQVQNTESSITFTYQQMGVKMDGRFRKFSAQLAFDPARPTAAKAAFDIDLASVDTGSSEADQEVAGKPWFNSKTFPTARFVASSVKAQGGNRYDVLGKLTIKGQTQEITIPATFNPQGKSASFDGSFILHRADFSIGEGSWAKFDIVANDILIKFHISSTQ